MLTDESDDEHVALLSLLIAINVNVESAFEGAWLDA